MDVETLKKITQIKIDLKVKLTQENKKFKWFWEDRIVLHGLSYSNFMGMLNGNCGVLNSKVEKEINKYLTGAK